MLSENGVSDLKEALQKARLVPVAAFSSVDAALKVSEILLKFSLPLIEITLRTREAILCTEAVCRQFPEMLVGSGSVLDRDSFKEALDVGSRFGVAPCLDLEILAFTQERGVPFMPGIATPSELNEALKAGCRFIKVFPAESLGGPAYIRALTAPFKLRDFFLVPTGGINENNVRTYLEADRVLACGATYIVESRLIDKGDFREIEKRIERFSFLMKETNP